ncbi:MAG: hypothetical protein JNN12_10050 [Bacteroidetes Order II. Incertae sedis bacterium]|nr:hypothetical protein [Bacteroidetes Order II. bacterium]
MSATKHPKKSFSAIYTLLEWVVVLFLLFPARAEAQSVTLRDQEVPAAYATTDRLLAVQLQEVYHPNAKATKPHDPWLGFDKVQHLVFSYLLVLGNQYVLVNKMTFSETEALKFSVGSTAMIGLFKEIYDLKRSKSRYFSKRDLVADAAGILLAVGVIRIKTNHSSIN